MVWACEKFQDYILGKKLKIETDHKLVPLLNSKHLDNLPPRVLRFRLRMMRYDYTVEYVLGKSLYVADMLSRSPLPIVDEGLCNLSSEADLYVDAVVQSLPAGESRLQEYSSAQARDPVCSQVKEFCNSEWPSKYHISKELQPYWEARS